MTFFFFFFNDTATTEIYTLSLHDALPISCARPHQRIGADHGVVLLEDPALRGDCWRSQQSQEIRSQVRSEEHTSELQSRLHLVCRLLLEKKKKTTKY